MYIEENGWMLELIFDLSSQALIQMINQLFHTAYSDEEKIWKEWQRANSIGLKVGETNRYEFQVRRLDGCTQIYAENNFLPDFADIPEETAKAAKFMIISYPANPVCSVADDSFYEKAIAFAKKYNVILLHDNAYSDIIFGGKEGKSFLSYKGAMEVGIEFYSLSKSYNMTGMRISFALGNKDVIRIFRKVRSQIDYGIFLPIQKAAVAALTGPQDNVKEQCRIYEERNYALCRGMSSIGWKIPDGQGTMFVWAPIPENYTSSERFTLDLMEKTGMIVTPGTAFGNLGEGYVRIALVHPVETIEKVVRIVKESGILEP